MFFPKSIFAAAAFLVVSASALLATPPAATRTPLHVVLDLNIGESQTVRLPNGGSATVRLVDVTVKHDSQSAAVRSAAVQVEVNGVAALLGCSNYHLPRYVGGAQIDCSVVKAYNANTDGDKWGLEKDARLRVWPGDSAWAESGTFGYPVKQKWFATDTQMANEPTFVNQFESGARKKIYYHNDLDFGGCEGFTEIVAATDGLVVSVAAKTLPGYADTPVRQRYDVVYLLDDRGWYYRYSHMESIDPGVKLGSTVKRGQRIGVLGKEGGSGGWSHQHFGIVSRQPSGKWGTEEAYAFAWEAYRNEYKPKLIAVARPHHVVATGEAVQFDAGKSWCDAGEIARYEWTFRDGKTATGARATRSYAVPGAYSEILKVTDSRGNVSYDFSVVHVIDPQRPTEVPPTIHPSYHPTMGIRPNMPVTFKVRSFGTTEGEETWNFGDGTPPMKVKSDGNVKSLAKDGYAITTHAFARAGTYLVTVERENQFGYRATGHLAVEVGP